MKKEALVSRETVIELTKKLRIEAIKYVFFDPSMLQEYEGILKKLVKEKQAKAKFQEGIWFMKDRFANITFNFKLNLKKQHKFNVPLKCYVRQKKEGEINTTSIQTSLNYTKESIELTQGFSNNFDVKLITGECRKSELKRSIRGLFHLENDIALLYFSGHGVITSTVDYIATTNYEEDDEGMSMEEILVYANKSKAKNKIIMLDCCHSGKFESSAMLEEDGLASICDVLTVLTASRVEEMNQH
ncbi:caspase family protein [Bacillus cereus group sp. MYBK234-1]|uniref:caspase family protein n=1 Tax=unclassified Bacillus cereus group TaxID=2750818 RepID=UPI003F78BF5C